MTLIDEYLEIQEKYEKKYGNNTILLMQVGHFFEAYGVDNDIEKLNSENLYNLSNIMNIQMTRKNKSIIENSRGNPLMLGVNIYSIDKFIQILLNNNYTIVLSEQMTQPPYVKREITNIYSPGTNVSHSIKGDTNNLLSIYIETTNKNIMCVGMSVIDLSTGSNKIYESYSNNNDKNYALDEIFRFIQTYDPKELVIIYKNLDFSDNNQHLNNYLDLSQRVVHYYDLSNIDSSNSHLKNYCDLNYQQKLLDKIFNNNGMLSIHEFLDIENKYFGTISYISLLDFAYEHNSTIITKISKPSIIDNNKYLCLTNNSINQLNLIAHKTCNSNYTFNSVFSVIDNTSTNLGKRLLRERLLNPIININLLEKRYNYIDLFRRKYNSNIDEINNNQYIYKILEKNLTKILDIERLHRKISLKLIQPCDFGGLDLSYENIISIYDFLNNIDGNGNGNGNLIKELLPSTDIIKQFRDFIETYNKHFNMDEIVKYHLDKISSSFFNKGIYSSVDKCNDNIELCKNTFENIISRLGKYIEDSEKSKFKNKYTMLKLEYTERDGYYITLTSKRATSLKKELKKLSDNNKEILKINIKNTCIDFNINNLEYKTVTKTSVKLSCDYLKQLSNEYVKYINQLNTLCKDKFIETIQQYDTKYSNCLKQIVTFISNIDLIKSCAKTSIIYGYNRPTIQSENNDTSFINCKELRHPIIERIQNNYEYIPNDIILDDNNNGMLLFGTNASGKSSLMKAIGINIIMAQAGFFVAATKFNYSPYKYLFTRINNNDNIFKGESSFAVEMSELRSILKRATKNSLVLGDELCSGTESISALSIFSASVIQLNKNNTNFIFATHLHELCKIPQVMEIENVKMYHLKVIFEKDSGKLIYDRKLTPGNGPAIYGLEVCKAMDMDAEFIMLSENIRKNLLELPDKILVPNKSHYNNDIYIDLCEMCNTKAQDIHHIKFQCSANENNIINNHIQKNIHSNLVSLCKKCHNDVHNGSININGYKQTSSGIILDYHKLNKIEILETQRNKKKISDIQIEIIKSLKHDNNKITQKNACLYLEKKHNIKISCGTYSKIINDKY